MRRKPTKEDLKRIREALRERSTDDDPRRNARDIFEAAIEETTEQYPKRDALGFLPWQRVIDWFLEGVHSGDTGPDTIPITWGTLFGTARLTAMIAGVMYKHQVWVNDFSEEVDVCPGSYGPLSLRR